jgi:phosphoribosylaminoimidazolecarboxamide formyltransferase/IMP cyclohydrolase
VKKRAVISVSDKTGIVELAKGLVKHGIEIVSTGGTAKVLREAGLEIIGISDITGFPECLDGRVKTLHPMIHAGVLAMRSNDAHMKQIDDLGVAPVDFVIINLYPFKQTILKEGVEREDAIENIDIGGPTMLRAAAKNYQDVSVIIDPTDYDVVLKELDDDGEVSQSTKFKLAAKVFENTAHYDAMIAEYLRKEAELPEFPEMLTLTFEKAQTMRYGENPHQKAVFYKEVKPKAGSLTKAEQLHGKELSYNNINDTNGALDLLKEFDETAVVAVKHANPCGVGVGETVHEAYMRAYEADPVSVFGGIIVTNVEMDEQTAQEINKIFIEIVVAPSYTQGAIAVLTKKKNIRVLVLPDITAKIPKSNWDMKKVYGGLLVQGSDTKLLNDDNELKIVTDRNPSDQEMKDLKFAWKVVKHAKSNAISIAKNGQSLGVGPGQVNRIWATQQAIEHAGDQVKGSVLASDAFFPFDDCVEAAAAAGITAIIQPGGSVNDKDSIAACNKHGIAMVLTGMRHFKH